MKTHGLPPILAGVGKVGEFIANAHEISGSFAFYSRDDFRTINCTFVLHGECSQPAVSCAVGPLWLASSSPDGKWSAALAKQRSQAGAFVLCSTWMQGNVCSATMFERISGVSQSMLRRGMN